MFMKLQTLHEMNLICLLFSRAKINILIQGQLYKYSSYWLCDTVLILKNAVLIAMLCCCCVLSFLILDI